MESGLITRQQLQHSSSSYSKAHGPENGRLNFAKARGKTGAWSAATNDENQHLQVDFLRNVKLAKFATQGRQDYRQWVKKYKLAYSLDGLSAFETYQVNGVDKVSMKFKSNFLCRKNICTCKMRSVEEINIRQCIVFRSLKGIMIRTPLSITPLMRQSQPDMYR